jgi:hypothetical protein
MYNKCKSCDKVRDCNLRRGFRDLCRKQPPQIFAVKPKPEHEGVPNPRYEGKLTTAGTAKPYNEFGQMVERNRGKFGKQTFLALKRLLKTKPNGHDEDQPTSWEEYSATPYQSTHDHTPYWVIPNEHNLRPTEAGFEIITRRQKKLMQHLAEQKRRQEFMIRHGFKLKDELQWLIVNDPTRAQTVASMLKLDDWIAIDQAGGLKN